MIDNLNISFSYRNVKHSLDVPIDPEALPYNLASAFAEVILKAEVNEYIVVEELKEELCIDSNKEN